MTSYFKSTPTKKPQKNIPTTTFPNYFGGKEVDFKKSVPNSKVESKFSKTILRPPGEFSNAKLLAAKSSLSLSAKANPPAGRTNSTYNKKVNSPENGKENTQPINRTVSKTSTTHSKILNNGITPDISHLGSIFPEKVTPLEMELNRVFDQVIDILNGRRKELIKNIHVMEMRKRSRDIECREMVEEINKTKHQIETGLKQNHLKKIQEEIVKKLEEKLDELHRTVKRQIHLKIDTHELERCIATVGEVIESESIDYTAFKPVMAVGVKGDSAQKVFCNTLLERRDVKLESWKVHTGLL